jgi:hypothetical protein
MQIIKNVTNFPSFFSQRNLILSHCQKNVQLRSNLRKVAEQVAQKAYVEHQIALCHILWLMSMRDELKEMYYSQRSERFVEKWRTKKNCGILIFLSSSLFSFSVGTMNFFELFYL